MKCYLETIKGEKMEIKKNQEYIVEIIDNGFEGEGIAKLADALTLEHMKIKKIGEDALLEGKVKRCLPES